MPTSPNSSTNSTKRSSYHSHAQRRRASHMPVIDQLRNFIRQGKNAATAALDSNSPTSLRAKKWSIRSKRPSPATSRSSSPKGEKEKGKEKEKEMEMEKEKEKEREKDKATAAADGKDDNVDTAETKDAVEKLVKEERVAG